MASGNTTITLESFKATYSIVPILEIAVGTAFFGIIEGIYKDPLETKQPKLWLRTGCGVVSLSNPKYFYNFGQKGHYSVVVRDYTFVKELVLKTIT